VIFANFFVAANERLEQELMCCSHLLVVALQFFDFASKKKSQALTIQKGLLVGLSVSPDGRWILYSEFGAVTGDIMLIENFAR